MQNNTKTILVVEDERALLEAIMIKLSKSGFKILSTRNIKQAKEYLSGPEKIDAIWLDHYLLGKESGLDLIVWCKENNNKCKETPIFIVSNTVSSDKVLTYMSLGANKFFVKSNHSLDEIIKDIAKSVLI